MRQVRLVLLCLVVGDEQLAVAAVPLGLLLGRAHDVDEAPRAADLVEDGVHLLERAVRRLGIEEVHRGHDEGVDDGEDDVRLVADAIEGDGGDDCDSLVSLLYLFLSLSPYADLFHGIMFVYIYIYV